MLATVETMSRLLVIAHPDDEVIFLWPFLEGDCSDLTILCCTSDFNNPKRSFCKFRKNALAKVAELKGASLVCIDNPSDLPEELGKRRLEGQGDESAPFRAAIDKIGDLVEDLSKGCEYVATHNPMGEYGHLDHKIVFDVVLKRSMCEIRYTDICMSTNWQRELVIPTRVREIFYKEKISDHEINENLLSFAERAYKLTNGWTWSRDIPQKCSVFRI